MNNILHTSIANQVNYFTNVHCDFNHNIISSHIWLSTYIFVKNLLSEYGIHNDENVPKILHTYMEIQYRTLIKGGGDNSKIDENT